MPPLARRVAALGALLLLALPLTGSSCHGKAPLPALVASSPSDGAVGVPRVAWVDLQFAGSVSSADQVDLSCDDVRVPSTRTRVGSDRVVVNPTADLPPSASCLAYWTGASGVESIAFTTAAAGPSAELLYDRTDPRAIAPLPDDLWLAPDASTPSGWHVAAPPRTVPGGAEQNLTNALIGLANQADGWSAVGHAAFETSEALDPAALPMTPAASLDPVASIGWFDLTSGSPAYGQRIPFQLVVRSDVHPTTGLLHHTLMLFPSVRLEEKGRYGIVVTRRALAASGRPLAPSPAFAAVLGPPQAGEPAVVTDARALTSEVLDDVAAAGDVAYDGGDVAVALRLTVRSDDEIPSDMLAIRSQVDALPTPGFTITSAVASGQAGVAAEVRGAWQAPNFRSALGVLARDANGLPVQTGTASVPFVLALPDASLSGPAPLVMYQHGNPGSAEEVPGNAGLTDDTGTSLAGAGFALMGFTDPINREIGQNLDTQSIVILTTLIGQGYLLDFDAQSWAEQMAFVKLLQSLGSLDVLPLGAPDGTPDLDPSTLLYLGISQGAVKGSATMAYLPEIRAAALTVGGARLAELLIHQADFTGLLATLEANLPNITPTEVWTGLVAYQMGNDRSEPHNHAIYLYRQPHALGTPARASLLLTEGIGDEYIPNNASRALVATLGPVLQVEPVAEASPVVPSVPGPLTANVDASTTAGYFQYVPLGVPGLPASPGCTFIPSGHGCPQLAPEAIRQRLVFFLTALTDPAPTIIDPYAPVP